MKKKLTGILLVICIAGSMVLSGYKTADPKDKVLKDLPTSWDPTEIYADDEAFEADMERLDTLIPEVEKLRGTLNTPEGFLRYYEAPPVIEMNEIINKGYMYINEETLDIQFLLYRTYI